MQTQNVDPEERLRDLIERYQVVWEVHPVEVKPLDAPRLQVGFEITLAGGVADIDHDGSTLEERVAVVSDVLREIAEDLCEHASRPDGCEFDVYDITLQESPRRHFRDESSLKIAIAHPDERPEPADDIQRACVHAMEGRLRELGAEKGAWKEKD